MLGRALTSELGGFVGKSFGNYGVGMAIGVKVRRLAHGGGMM